MSVFFAVFRLQPQQIAGLENGFTLFGTVEQFQFIFAQFAISINMRRYKNSDQDLSGSSRPGR